MQLTGVGRIAASLRHQLWNDESATIGAFELDKLSETVPGFQAAPIYGWDFFDSRDNSWAAWRDTLSLDEVLGPESNHWIDLFQEGGTVRHPDLRFWFKDLVILNINREVMPVEDGNDGPIWPHRDALNWPHPHVCL